MDLAANAARVRSMGITTFAVGVGRALEVELRVSSCQKRSDNFTLETI